MGDFKIIGITGSIGAGKSSVGRLLQKKGQTVFDLDLIGRDLIQNSPHTLSIYEKTLGPTVIKNGVLDKDETRKLLYQSPTKLEELNRQIHPLIWDAFFKAAIASKAKLVFCESAILVETKSYQKLDGLIVVTSPWEKRRERLLSRGEKDPDSIEKNQLSEAAKIKEATFVIKNEGIETDLENQVDQVLNQLLSRH